MATAPAPTPRRPETLPAPPPRTPTRDEPECFKADVKHHWHSPDILHWIGQAPDTPATGETTDGFYIEDMCLGCGTRMWTAFNGDTLDLVDAAWTPGEYLDELKDLRAQMADAFEVALYEHITATRGRIYFDGDDHDRAGPLTMKEAVENDLADREWLDLWAKLGMAFLPYAEAVKWENLDLEKYDPAVYGLLLDKGIPEKYM